MILHVLCNNDTSAISGVTVDNGANIKKAIRELNFPFLGCFGHTINLAVKAGLKHNKAHVATAHCSRIVTQSPKSNYIVEQKQEALELPKHKFIQDEETRWNSTLDMISRILEQQAALCATLAEVKKMDLLPTACEFKLLEDLVEVLKPFKDITSQLSGEKYVTISIIKPILHHVLNDVLKVSGSESACILQIKMEMKTNLEPRYQDPDVQNILNNACILDPRFKHLPFLENDERQLLLKNILDELVQMIVIDNEDNEDNEDEITEPPLKKKSVLASLLGDMLKPTARKRMTRRETAEAELKTYLEDEIVNIDTDVLKWWKSKHHLFPTMAYLARKYLCIPATSTPSERLFSTAGNIISSISAGMHPNNASMLCFLAENL